MARPKGFEPLTPRFVVWCSIQLSYGRPAAWIDHSAARGSHRRSGPALQAFVRAAEGRGGLQERGRVGT